MPTLRGRLAAWASGGMRAPEKHDTDTCAFQASLAGKGMMRLPRARLGHNWLPLGPQTHTTAARAMRGAAPYTRPARRLSDRRACSARQYSSHAPGLAMGASAAQVRACAAAAAASTTPVSLAGRIAPRPDMPRGLPPSSTCTATSSDCLTSCMQGPSPRNDKGACLCCYRPLQTRCCPCIRGSSIHVARIFM